MKIVLPLLAVSTLACTVLFSQNITKECNFHRGEDVLIKKGIEFAEPDSGGRDRIWNFSTLKSTDSGCRVEFFSDSLDLSHIIGLEKETGYDFYERGDTLFIGRYFNRTLKVTFSSPEPVIKFPFSFGDTLSGNFAAKGVYSQIIPLKISGNTVIAADGEGEMISPNGDTILNVTRVHTLRSCRLIMKDTLDILHDKYAWYATGFRYPVFESIKVRHFLKDSVIVPHMGISFFYSPEKQVESLADDMPNDSVWEVMTAKIEALADSVRAANLGADDANRQTATTDSLSRAAKNLRLYPIPTVTSLYSSFIMNRDANVVVELYDRGFRKLRCIDWGTIPEGDCLKTIDVSALSPGMYHIHFIFGGEVVRLAFVKGI